MIIAGILFGISAACHIFRHRAGLVEDEDDVGGFGGLGSGDRAGGVGFERDFIIIGAAFNRGGGLIQDKTVGSFALFDGACR